MRLTGRGHDDDDGGRTIPAVDTTTIPIMLLSRPAALR
jgi:hypothetical protein